MESLRRFFSELHTDFQHSITTLEKKMDADHRDTAKEQLFSVGLRATGVGAGGMAVWTLIRCGTAVISGGLLDPLVFAVETLALGILSHDCLVVGKNIKNNARSLYPLNTPKAALHFLEGRESQKTLSPSLAFRGTVINSIWQRIRTRH